LGQAPNNAELYTWRLGCIPGGYVHTKGTITTVEMTNLSDISNAKQKYSDAYRLNVYIQIPLKILVIFFKTLKSNIQCFSLAVIFTVSINGVLSNDRNGTTFPHFTFTPEKHFSPVALNLDT